MEPLVSTDWLAARLDEPDLAIVDATWLLGAPEGEARRRFEAGHIPGAGFLDLDQLGDALSDPADAANPIAAAGIAPGCRTILYDDSPYRTAARGWWLLRQFGLRDVAILDGGLGKWRAERRPLRRGDSEPVIERVAPATPGASFKRKDDVTAATESGAAQIVDARSPGRFAGSEPEPRRDVAPGHIPGARNVHYTTLFHDDGTWKRDITLRAAFEDAGVEIERPVIATCGSGVTAGAIVFGLHLLGRPDAGLYDGSWSEWGTDPATPKETGA